MPFEAKIKVTFYYISIMYSFIICIWLFIYLVFEKKIKNQFIFLYLSSNVSACNHCILSISSRREDKLKFEGKLNKGVYKVLHHLYQVLLYFIFYSHFSIKTILFIIMIYSRLILNRFQKKC